MLKARRLNVAQFVSAVANEPAVAWYGPPTQLFDRTLDRATRLAAIG